MEKEQYVPMFGMGVAQADINEDRLPDLFVTNIGNPVQLISSEDGWIDMALAMGLGLNEEQSTCWGADWHDVNNDGELISGWAVVRCPNMKTRVCRTRNLSQTPCL